MAPSPAALLACGVLKWACPSPEELSAPLIPRKQCRRPRRLDQDLRGKLVPRILLKKTMMARRLWTVALLVAVMRGADQLRCGCDLGSLRPIAYGAARGTECVRTDECGAPGWDEGCGTMCLHASGRQIVQFCPRGLMQNCTVGCVRVPVERLEQILLFSTS